MSTNVKEGTIKLWNERGFGFLKTSEGDRFFHVSSFKGDEHSIAEGLEVTFEIGPGKDGRPAAINVRPANVADDVLPDGLLLSEVFADR